MFSFLRLRSRTWLSILADFGLLLLVGIPIIIFSTSGTPFKRGFYCDDDSLRYPYMPSTVPSWLLFAYGFILPLITIICTEWIIRKFYFGQPVCSSYLSECYKHCVAFLFGAGCTLLTTDIGKYTIGRLRPHFFDVCSPLIDCKDPSIKNTYITDFLCKGTDESLLKDMRLSFPSGHSSFSSYCMVFMAMYCGAKMKWPGSRRLKIVIQFAGLILAFFTGLSRVSDYKHHWSDVLAGFALGSGIAVLVIMFVSDLFPRRVDGLRAEEEPNTSLA